MWKFFKVFISSFFNLIGKILSYVLPILLIILFLFVGSFLFSYFKIKRKENIKKVPSNSYIKKGSNIFKTLFIQFPKMIAYDMLHSDPFAFNEFGIHMVCGKQGSGKTMTVVYLLRKWAQKYPKLQIYTNMDYKYQNGELNTFEELIERKNGIYGVVNVIDEIQNWLPSSDSKNVPVSVLSEISQQRKQKKAIVGTGQVFGKLSKPLREQTHFIYLPRTYLGCLTVVWVAEAEDYDAERNRFRRKKFGFIFAHDLDLRNAYDTYKKIERYKDVQFRREDSEISLASGEEVRSLT